MQYQAPQKKRLNSSQLILLALLIIAILMAVIASFIDGVFEWRGLLVNLSTEVMGAILTYAIIENIVRNSSNKEELKKSLIRRLENPEISVTWQVIQELRHHGWLNDGSLYGWFLKRANLQGVDLRDANLNGLGLYRCNLKDVRVENEQLASMNDLRRSIMPDGNLYNGRFCLKGDLEWASSHYGVDVNKASVEEMADYYDVSLEEYVAGQKWAIINLPKLDVQLPHYITQIDWDRY